MPNTDSLESYNITYILIIIFAIIIELDWLFGWMVADRCSVLGNGRVFVKKMLKYVPGMWLTILSV